MNLTEAAKERKKLSDAIRNFDPYAHVSPPRKIEIEEKGTKLAFEIDEKGFVASTPPVWGWAKGWRWRDMLQYFKSRDLPYRTYKELGSA